MLSKEEIQKQLDFTQSLIEKLKPYTERTINELPDNIIIDVHNIKVGPRVTNSGIESVLNVLNGLFAAEFYLDWALKDPEGFRKNATKKIIVKKTISKNIKSLDITSKSNQIQTPSDVKINIDNHISSQSTTPKPSNTSSKVTITIPPSHTPPPGSQIHL